MLIVLFFRRVICFSFDMLCYGVYYSVSVNTVPTRTPIICFIIVGKCLYHASITSLPNIHDISNITIKTLFIIAIISLAFSRDKVEAYSNINQSPAPNCCYWIKYCLLSGKHHVLFQRGAWTIRMCSRKVKSCYWDRTFWWRSKLWQWS